MRDFAYGARALGRRIASQRRRLHHCQRLRGRVSGLRPVLPSGRQRMPIASAALGHGNLVAQDTGSEAPLDGVQDGGPLQAKVETPYGLRTCFDASVPRSAGRKPLVARFGGISLTRQKAAVLMDRQVANPRPRRELITRLSRGKCELCGTPEDVRVHHIRKLADLNKGEPPTE